MRTQVHQRKNRAVQARIPLAVVIAVACVCGFMPAQRPAQSAAARSAYVAPAERVDINHATVAELMKVPGMTRSWAGRIVRFRPYRTKQDLLDHGVVTSEVYERIKAFIIAHH